MNIVLNKYCGVLVGVLVGDCFGFYYEGIFIIIFWEEVIDYIMIRINDIKGLIFYIDDLVMI